ncbi:MAG: pyruvate ferredoxin oxidoreductase [Candidatus Firestonebacteria bacterium]|nr:pyruvate ferredoxin oxidoreductase [Candidatus Firestonebacteria bacterium]
MATLKELSVKKEYLTNGHRLCAGCGASIIARQVLMGLKDDEEVVVGCATGCLEVSTTIYPYTAWECSFIHNAFENSAATISGVEKAYQALLKKGKINKKIKFLAMGGDGGTYDIGFQSLSGAMERGHNMVYVCYDNEAYMNTGIQRSSATPHGADTTTTPAGKVIHGKKEYRKDLTECMVAHDIPYVAQASPHNWRDLVQKAEKAFSVNGPAFINVISPCPRGWRYEANVSIQMAKLAVETCFWPLYEVENGVYKINYIPQEKKPILEWVKLQGRFRHLMRDDNKYIIDELQADLDRKWDSLLRKSNNK